MPTKQTKKSATTTKTRFHTHVKLALVPHKANQYRPHAIRRYGIVAIVMLVVIAQGSYNALTSGNALGTQAAVTTAGLLDATNAARSQEGEQPLVLNDQLSQAARLKVQNMFDSQYWAHIAPDGTTPWHWLSEAGYVYAEAGENLARNFTTSDSTVSAWLASPSHRANILKSEYKDVGFAVTDGTLNGKATTLVVALYGTSEQTAVQGSLASTQVSNIDTPLSIMARLGLGFRSLSPVAISSVIVLLLAANVALIAHAYRRKLPVALRRSWYRHHGMYKAIGLTSLAIIMIVAYGSVGQI